MAKKARNNNSASRKAVPGRKAVSPRPTPSTWLTRDWVRGFLLAAAVILIYQPVWYAGFVWDDDHLTANPTIVGPLAEVPAAYRSCGSSRYV
jgi:hypothetical protein